MLYSSHQWEGTRQVNHMLPSRTLVLPFKCHLRLQLIPDPDRSHLSTRRSLGCQQLQIWDLDSQQRYLNRKGQPLPTIMIVVVCNLVLFPLKMTRTTIRWKPSRNSVPAPRKSKESNRSLTRSKCLLTTPRDSFARTTRILRSSTAARLLRPFTASYAPTSIRVMMILFLQMCANKFSKMLSS